MAILDSVNITEIINEFSSLGVFLIVMLEYANIPLPSEIVLPLVGILVANGSLDFFYALIISVLGGLTGSIINYWIGWKFGNPVVIYILRKFPKTKQSIKKSIYYIEKYDKLSVLIARIIPLARTFISIPAGTIKMNISSFIVYSTIGITLWNLFLITLGYWVGNNVQLVSQVLSKYAIIISLVILIYIVYIYIRKKLSNR